VTKLRSFKQDHVSFTVLEIMVTASVVNTGDHHAVLI